MAIEKRWVKIATYVILGLMVVGFSVPGFLDWGEDQQVIEPRLCQNDAECYLLCDEIPVRVLCSQNMCLKNSCSENSYYEYVEEPITFTLLVEVEKNEIGLEEDSKNMFVIFEDNEVKLHALGLSLGHILEKGGVYLDSRCLTIGKEEYRNGEIFLLVNGKESYSYSQYVPEEGDLVEIVYS